MNRPFIFFFLTLLLSFITFSLRAQYEDIKVKAIRKENNILLLDEKDSMLCIIKNCPEESTVYSTDSIVTFSISNHFKYADNCNGYEITYRRYYRGWRAKHYKLSEEVTFYVVRRYPYNIKEKDDDYVCLEFEKIILRKDKIVIFFNYIEDKTPRNFEIYYPYNGNFDYKHFSGEVELQLKSQKNIHRNYESSYFVDKF